MIKAVFFDIDGTIVSYKTHKILEEDRLSQILLLMTSKTEASPRLFKSWDLSDPDGIGGRGQGSGTENGFFGYPAQQGRLFRFDSTIVNLADKEFPKNHQIIDAGFQICPDRTLMMVRTGIIPLAIDAVERIYFL